VTRRLSASEPLAPTRVHARKFSPAHGDSRPASIPPGGSGTDSPG
jgi:hypothetical protein